MITRSVSTSLAIVLAACTFPCCAATTGTDRRQAGPTSEPVKLTSYAAVYHVSAIGGSDTTGDGSKARPWGSVRHALEHARETSPQRRAAILVASGTYAGAELQLKRHVDLFGGFEPANWSRDIFVHATVLDANGAGRVVLGADEARLDGFTLRNGRVRGPGGAILCNRTSPTITNNTIVDNQTVEPEGYVHELLHQLGNDGGAIACLDGAAPVIANNVIARNGTGVGGGGGIAAANYSTPTISGNVIADNVTGRTDRNQSRSSNGGAISCNNVPVRHDERKHVIRLGVIRDNLILNNRVGGKSDAGGVYCEFDAHVEISRNLILGNAAEDDGGGIYVMKGADPLIRGNVIAGNRGGGAVRISKEGRARIENNVIYANSSGDVNCIGSWMVMVHNTVADNLTGNGLSYENFSPHLRPSIVTNNIFHHNQNDKLKIEPKGSAVFTHNLVVGGGGADGTPADGNFDADPMFEDDGIIGVEARRATYDPQRVQTTLALAAPMPDATHLIGRPVRAGERWGVVVAVRGSELIAWGDLAAGGSTGDAPLKFDIPRAYRLRAGSPCIDKGASDLAPATDFDGDPRPTGAAPDIGADEFRPRDKK